MRRISKEEFIGNFTAIREISHSLFGRTTLVRCTTNDDKLYIAKSFDIAHIVNKEAFLDKFDYIYLSNTIPSIIKFNIIIETEDSIIALRPFIQGLTLGDSLSLVTNESNISYNYNVWKKIVEVYCSLHSNGISFPVKFTNFFVSSAQKPQQSATLSSGAPLSQIPKLNTNKDNNNKNVLTQNKLENVNENINNKDNNNQSIEINIVDIYPAPTIDYQVSDKSEFDKKTNEAKTFNNCNAIVTPDPKNFVFMAPEYFTHKYDIDAKSDMWSLGAVLIYMSGISLPWSTVNICAMIRQFSSLDGNEIVKNLPENTPKHVKLIAEKLLVYNPNHRSTAEQIMNFSPTLELPHWNKVVSRPKRNSLGSSIGSPGVNSLGNLKNFVSVHQRSNISRLSKVTNLNIRTTKVLPPLNLAIRTYSPFSARSDD